MIKVVRRGDYRILGAKSGSRTLILDGKDAYKWSDPNGNSQLEATFYRHQQEDRVLASGKYRLYYVQHEPAISDFFHLELSNGQKKWQGYLLPVKLETAKQKKYKIVPTKELITRRCMCCACGC